MSLSICLLTNNNSKTIEKCLTSVFSIDCNIIIGDLGSTDDTLEICKKFNPEIYKVNWKDDFSKAKNYVVQKSNSDWILFLEPWEFLVKGHDKIQMLNEDEAVPTAYLVQVMQGKNITKEVRIWNKSTSLRFKNPVHEHIDVQCSNLMPVVIFSQEKPNPSEKLKIIDRWMEKNPTLSSPHYYKACNFLLMEKYDDFINEANQYLFQENQGKSVVMMKYYMSIIMLTHKRDYKSSIQQILPCLAVRPLMAEFWCLLADIYYQMKEYKKAKSLYLNGILMGQKRLSNDDWPVDLQKYKEYPKKMISSCDKILEETKVVY